MAYQFKPQDDSYPPFYKKYVDQIEDLPLLDLLKKEMEHVRTLLNNLSEEKAEFRYAPGKWTVKESLIHILDTAYIFTFRALSISRGEQHPLPGFDQDAYMEHLKVEGLTLSEVVNGLIQFLEFQLSYSKLIGPEALKREGSANNYKFRASTILYISAAHTRHHMNVLQERYELF